jgi:hypothetical protein
VETEYDGTNIAAFVLGILEGNIYRVLDGSTYFVVPFGEHTGMYDAQRYPKTREWKTDVKTRFETHEKAVVAYDENDEIVCRYDSASKAAKAEKINAGTIGACARHEPGSSYAGKKDGSELRWEYKDPEERSFYDEWYPRKPKRPFYYYDENGIKIDFKTITEAAKKTCGKFVVGTQRKAIGKSIESYGKMSCKVGYFWHKID